MKTESISLLNRVDTRLAACAALAAGTALTAVPAQADIISSGPININIPSTTSGVYLNVVTGVTGSSSATTALWDVNPWSSTSLSLFNNAVNQVGGQGVYVGTGATYFNLTIGSLIGPGSTFAGTGTNTVAAGTPLNFNSSNNYIGFRFNNEVTGAVNYGYFQVSLSGTAASQPRAIVGYAYDNTGAGITIVPEPSTFALLGLFGAGALGVRAWRRNKAA